MSGGSVEDAIALALQAHRGQTYAATDQPFILHPLRVMLRFEDPLLQTVAVLHDVVEDTDVSLESLSRAGFRAEVISGVNALTRRRGEPYHLYIERVARNQIASRVKCADLAENLANNQRDPAAPGNADRIRRYRAALLRLETDTNHLQALIRVGDRTRQFCALIVSDVDLPVESSASPVCTSGIALMSGPFRGAFVDRLRRTRFVATLSRWVLVVSLLPDRHVRRAVAGEW